MLVSLPMGAIITLYHNASSTEKNASLLMQELPGESLS